MGNYAVVKTFKGKTVANEVDTIQTKSTEECPRLRLTNLDGTYLIWFRMDGIDPKGDGTVDGEYCLLPKETRYMSYADCDGSSILGSKSIDHLLIKLISESAVEYYIEVA